MYLHWNNNKLKAFLTSWCLRKKSGNTCIAFKCVIWVFPNFFCRLLFYTAKMEPFRAAGALNHFAVVEAPANTKKNVFSYNDSLFFLQLVFMLNGKLENSCYVRQSMRWPRIDSCLNSSFVGLKPNPKATAKAMANKPHSIPTAWLNLCLRLWLAISIKPENPYKQSTGNSPFTLKWLMPVDWH